MIAHKGQMDSRHQLGMDLRVYSRDDIDVASITPCSPWFKYTNWNEQFAKLLAAARVCTTATVLTLTWGFCLGFG